jgi:hypothetical protein
MLKQLKNSKGQAAIEMALSLPFIIWLIYYTINAFYMIHSGHVAQKYAAMGLYQRLNNRAKYVVDDVANSTFNRGYMAVRYTEPEGDAPLRKILIGPNRINNIVGICRDPGDACN